MLKTRIILAVASAAIIGLIFMLPKAVVENDSEMEASGHVDSTASLPVASPHQALSKGSSEKIKGLRARYLSDPTNEKNAIFADSLAKLYKEAGKFDSAAWFAKEVSTFLKTKESFLKAGDYYYQAFTFAVDALKQQQLAEEARGFFEKVLVIEPGNLEAKTKMAMTYVSSSTPMKGILMLREVIAQDPKNELALFNLGMLSVQSGQYDKAIERLEELEKINPENIQGQLLLGVAYMNKGDKAKAKQQFEKVKKLDKDPSVQATADSYLNDLK